MAGPFCFAIDISSCASGVVLLCTLFLLVGLACMLQPYFKEGQLNLYCLDSFGRIVTKLAREWRVDTVKPPRFCYASRNAWSFTRSVQPIMGWDAPCVVTCCRLLLHTHGCAPAALNETMSGEVQCQCMHCGWIKGSCMLLGTSVVAVHFVECYC